MGLRKSKRTCCGALTLMLGLPRQNTKRIAQHHSTALVPCEVTIDGLAKVLSASDGDLAAAAAVVSPRRSRSTPSAAAAPLSRRGTGESSRATRLCAWAYYNKPEDGARCASAEDARRLEEDFTPDEPPRCALPEGASVGASVAAIVVVHRGIARGPSRTRAARFFPNVTIHNNSILFFCCFAQRASRRLATWPTFAGPACSTSSWTAGSASCS